MKNNGKYLEIKWQGRVGQGVMTAASILAEVLAMEGKYVQAFPGFNHEENAPFIRAYNRLSDSPIRFHSPVINTDITAIMDPSVILNANPGANGNGNPEADTPGEANADTGEKTCYIVNTSLQPQLIYEKLEAAGSIVYTLDAGTISREESGEPFANISLLTVLLHCIDWIPIEHFKQRLRELSAKRWGDRNSFNFASAQAKIIERSLREVRRFAGDDAAAKAGDAAMDMNKKTNTNTNTD
jgi:Pyruvate/2-oxoacid:ferredoxin oxidoreductase gamma subunit